MTDNNLLEKPIDLSHYSEGEKLYYTNKWDLIKKSHEEIVMIEDPKIWSIYLNKYGAELFVSACTKLGSLSGLKWVKEEKNYIFDKMTCAYAALGGHFELLKYIRNEGCYWNEWTCAFAAKGGHLELLKWLREEPEGDKERSPWNRRKNRCKWNEWTCEYAAEGGYLEILKWARANGGCPWNKYICENAARAKLAGTEGGHLELLKWARKGPEGPEGTKEYLNPSLREPSLREPCPWDNWTCIYAAKSGHFQLLKWAQENGCPWDEEVCTYAAKGGDLKLLTWKGKKEL